MELLEIECCNTAFKKWREKNNYEKLSVSQVHSLHGLESVDNAYIEVVV